MRSLSDHVNTAGRNRAKSADSHRINWSLMCASRAEREQDEQVDTVPPPPNERLPSPATPTAGKKKISIRIRRSIKEQSEPTVSADNERSRRREQRRHLQAALGKLQADEKQLSPDQVMAILKIDVKELVKSGTGKHSDKTVNSNDPSHTKSKGSTSSLFKMFNSSKSSLFSSLTSSDCSKHLLRDDVSSTEELSDGSFENDGYSTDNDSVFVPPEYVEVPSPVKLPASKVQPPIKIPQIDLPIEVPPAQVPKKKYGFKLEI